MLVTSDDSSAMLTEALVDLANAYEDKAVKIVGISSNSVQIKPQDAPDQMAADAKHFGEQHTLPLVDTSAGNMLKEH